MKKSVRALLNVAAVLALGANGMQSIAWADTTSATSTTELTAAAPSLKDKLAITYWGAYTGPSLGSPSTYIVDPRTNELDPTSPQNLYNQLKANYKIGKDAYIGPVVNFQLNPFMGGNLIMKDTGFRIGNANLIDRNGMKFAADVRWLAPLDPVSQSRNMISTISSLSNFTYAVPKTKLTLGLLQYHSIHIYSSNGTWRDLDFYAAPNLSYQFSKSVAGTLFYEFYPVHYIGSSFDNWRTLPSDINPGVSIDITENVNINPGLIIYPSNMTLNATGTIVYLSAKLL